MGLLIFLRSTRRRSFPLGFLCANKGLEYSEKASTVMFPFFASELIQQIGLLSSGLALIDFGCIQLCHLSELVSP